MFTPRTPVPIFFIILVVACMATPNLGNAQKSPDVSVQPRALFKYEASLKNYYQQKIKTECLEFQAKVKRKWWYYLPTLGYTFGLPNINGGTSTLVQLDIQRQQNRVKLATIISQGMLDYRTDLHKLRSMYQMLEIEEVVISDSRVTERIYMNIHGVALEAYNKKEIKPVEYNQALLAFQNGVISQEEKRRAYMNRVIEIAQFARYDFPTDSIPELEPLFIEKKKPASR